MPRVAYSEKQKQREAIVGVISKYQVIYGRDAKDVAKSIGLSTETYYRRRKEPGDFTLSEIKALIRTLRIPKEEILSILI